MDKDKEALEQAQASIKELESQLLEAQSLPSNTSHDTSTTKKMSRSSSMLELNSPPSANKRNSFMSPVEESVNSPEPSSTRTIRPKTSGDRIPASPSTPSQLPVLRLGRVDTLREPSSAHPVSPGSPSNGLKRSSTISNLSPATSTRPSFLDMSVSPARVRREGGMTRSTQLRNIPGSIETNTPPRGGRDRGGGSHAGPLSPTTARDRRSAYGAVTNHRASHTSTASIGTVGTSRKQSTGASNALASQRDMTSKTVQLLSRMGKLGIRTNHIVPLQKENEPVRSRVVSRKPSFSQMATHGFSAMAQHLGRSTRTVSGSSSSSTAYKHQPINNKALDHVYNQTDTEMDLTMVAGSPNSTWVHVARRSSEDEDGDSPTLNIQHSKTLRDRFLEEGPLSRPTVEQRGSSERSDRTLSSDSTSHHHHHQHKALPPRPGIPSPMTKHATHGDVSGRPSSRLSTRTPEFPGPAESKLPIVSSRPTSRMALRSSTVTTPRSTTTAAQPSHARPMSRQDLYARPPSRQDPGSSSSSAAAGAAPTSTNTTHHLLRSTSPALSKSTSGLPQPSTRHGTAGPIDQQAGRSFRRASAHLGKHRLAEPPIATVGSSGGHHAATGGGGGGVAGGVKSSRIPRKSVGRSGGASVSELPLEPVPPLPDKR